MRRCWKICPAWESRVKDGRVGAWEVIRKWESVTISSETLGAGSRFLSGSKNDSRSKGCSKDISFSNGGEFCLVHRPCKTLGQLVQEA